MLNTREQYEATAVLHATQALQLARTDAPGAQAIATVGLIYATLANAADRRSHGSITDEPSKRITP